MIDKLEQLTSAIDDRSAIIGVVGLGYVGLPVASCFAAAGFSVVGYDIDANRVAVINSGASPIEGDEPGLDDVVAEMVKQGRLRATTDPAELANAAVITVNVQTPVGNDNRPNHTAFAAAVDSVGETLQPGVLVIVESTVAPGTTDTVVRSRLEKASGLTEGRDFFLGACPERVMPGRLLKNIHHMPRVCGGSSPATAAAMKHLYRTVVDADLDTASIATAELVKVTENAYRDVQIAFANELALICRDQGDDVWRVRELVNKVPERHMHLPGGGVGGHCIPKDPWLLAASSTTPLRLVPAARAVNDGMPAVIADLALAGAEALNARGMAPSRAFRVVILGYAYLPESADTRNSPSAALVDELEKRGFEVVTHDPFVPDMGTDLDAAFTSSGIAVTMVHHTVYDSLERAVPLHIDARHLAVAAARIASLWDGAVV